MLRVVAGHDYARAEAIASTWPVDELLHAAMNVMRRHAVEEHRNALLVWASLAPHLRNKKPPPEVPDILKDE